MHKLGIYGRYHLLLAHHVCEHHEEYKELFDQVLPSTIIMDNSVVELGKPVDIDRMLRACKAVKGWGPNIHDIIVVLPDYMLNKEETINSSLRALEAWQSPLCELDVPVDFMAVAQGSDIGEWVSCLEILERHHEITWIGIPRNFREKLGGSRIQACQMAHILRRDWKQHLFGFSDDLHDDIVTCAMATAIGINLKGIDSAVPIRIGMKEKKHIMFSDQNHEPRGDWWDHPGDLANVDTFVRENLERINRWIA